MKILFILFTAIALPGLSQTEIKTLPGHPGGRVISMTLSPSGRALLSYGVDFKQKSPHIVYLWDIKTGTKKQISFAVPKDKAISAFGFGPTDNEVYAAIHDKIHVWKNGSSEIAEVEIKHGGPKMMANNFRFYGFNSTSSLLAISAKNYLIVDAKTGEKKSEIKEKLSVMAPAIFNSFFSNNDEKLVHVFGNTLLVSNVATGALEHEFEANSRMTPNIESIVVNGDFVAIKRLLGKGATVYNLSNKEGQFFNFEPSEIAKTFSPFLIGVSEDGTKIWVGTNERMVLLDKDGNVISEIKDSSIKTVSISKDWSVLAYSKEDGSLVVSQTIKETVK